MINELPDIPSYFIALAQWCACMVFILNLKRKVSGRALFLQAAGCLAAEVLLLSILEHSNTFLWLSGIASSVLVMILSVYLCCAVSWKDAAYVGLQAFVFGEFVHSLEWLCYCYYLADQDNFLLQNGVMILFYGILYLIYWILIRTLQTPEKNLEIQPQELLAVVLITTGVFVLSNVSLLYESTPFSSRYGESAAAIRTVVFFSGTSMLYAHLIQRSRLRAQRELAAMQQILQSQYQQYQQSRESIDLINYKYHDLKHQIAALRAEQDPEHRLDFLDRMEAEIQQYEAQNKTGNSILDTVLTSKSVVCEKNGITFNCVADGTLLDFMDVMDLCSIFGNALDNAIECEKEIEEQEKRLIHLAVFRQKNFLIIRLENYSEKPLQMQEGIPRTTKKNENAFHGYGLKSIRHTAEKYHGAMSIKQEDNWFELKILIPLPNGKEETA